MHLQLCLLLSEIYYNEKKYLKGFKIADKSIKIAKQIGTKDLYVEALLLKVKNSIKQKILSKKEVMIILDEAKMIAQEIGNPEVTWKVYFEYGRFFQARKKRCQALEYYLKCMEIFKEVMGKIKTKSYKKSYISRPDRQAVITAIETIQ